MDHVLAGRQCQVPLAEDQRPVRQLPAEAPMTPADGVHPWRPRQDRYDPRSFRLEHLPERGSEDRIAIMNQEPQRAGAVPGSMARLRACRTAHPPARCAVTPARCSRRVPCPVNTSTCSRCSSAVSATRKSRAMIACAWPVRLDYWIGSGRAGGLGSSLSDHFGRLPARTLPTRLPDGAVPGPSVHGRRALGAPARERTAAPPGRPGPSRATACGSRRCRG
jgi:hypothetical protein